MFDNAAVSDSQTQIIAPVKFSRPETIALYGPGTFSKVKGRHFSLAAQQMEQRGSFFSARLFRMKKIIQKPDGAYEVVINYDENQNLKIAFLVGKNAEQPRLGFMGNHVHVAPQTIKALQSFNTTYMQDPSRPTEIRCFPAHILGLLYQPAC